MESKQSNTCHYYPPLEEKLNVVSHGMGLALSVLALILLIFRGIELPGFKPIISFGVFGGSLILLYAASTFYHAATRPKLRYRLNILDHASIYVLIAGTYTPFALVTLEGWVGWSIFGVVWGIALTGIILKLFYTGKYQTLSTIMYVAMGWLIVLAIKPLMDNVAPGGLYWIFAGGMAYTIGAVVFSLNRIKFNHALFHILVLIGSFCHFLAIYYYVLPPEIVLD